VIPNQVRDRRHDADQNPNAGSKASKSPLKIAFQTLPLRPIMKYSNEISKRRTFAIISHPDAGKTTLTEKAMLFGGAIQTAGAVKSNKIKKHATSDFMEIEHQRGISVATSVMTFEYKKHADQFAGYAWSQRLCEDTYRTLTAVDSVILVIDSVNGSRSANPPPDGSLPHA